MSRELQCHLRVRLKPENATFKHISAGVFPVPNVDADSSRKQIMATAKLLGGELGVNEKAL